MSSVIISGDTSGAVTLAAPAVAGTNTLTLLAATATNSVNTLATAVASTSGTSIDFTGLPAWVKRITVMFKGVSLSGSAHILIQIGSGSITTTGYVSTINGTNQSNATGGTQSTSGFVVRGGASGLTITGLSVITLITTNTYVNAITAKGDTTEAQFGAGDVTLSGALDRVRITTTNGTDTFDAGTVNILYEG
jgi:hypothetical protein